MLVSTTWMPCFFMYAQSGPTSVGSWWTLGSCFIIRFSPVEKGSPIWVFSRLSRTLTSTPWATLLASASAISWPMGSRKKRNIATWMDRRAAAMSSSRAGRMRCPSMSRRAWFTATSRCGRTSPAAAGRRPAAPKRLASGYKARMPEPALAGLRVLEVGNFMAAPFCTLQLADLGADVIKIENPDGGDQVRTIAPFIEGESSGFVRLNRNKRSLALDLKAPRGKEVLRRLAQRADVLVENLRPGTMADLELDYPRLSKLNPRLVYVAASGWGQDGPYAQRPGLDIMAQGMSGLMSITGEEGGKAPVKIGVPVTDLTCALYGALAALAALRVRDRTGRGQFVDVNLFEAGVSLAVWEAGRYFATGEVPQPLGSAHQTSAPYQALRASDGFFTLGATTARNWEACCDVFGLPELKDDPRFAKNHLRHQNRRELIPILEEVSARRPAGHWVQALERAGVPCGLLQTYDQVFNDPHLNARGFFPDAPHTKLGRVKQIGSPMRMSATPPRMERAGPLLGEHTAEILSQIGYSKDEIGALETARVVRMQA